MPKGYGQLLPLIGKKQGKQRKRIKIRTKARAVKLILPRPRSESDKYIKKSTVNTKSLYIKKRGITISLPTSTLDPDANLRSFIPNLIHSMDASNIHLLISKIMEGLNKSNNDQNINLYTIHDCFQTTPYTMNLINQTVKAVFIDLYFEFY